MISPDLEGTQIFDDPLGEDMNSDSGEEAEASLIPKVILSAIELSSVKEINIGSPSSGMQADQSRQAATLPCHISSQRYNKQLIDGVIIGQDNISEIGASVPSPKRPCTSSQDVSRTSNEED